MSLSFLKKFDGNFYRNINNEPPTDPNKATPIKDFEQGQSAWYIMQVQNTSDQKLTNFTPTDVNITRSSQQTSDIEIKKSYPQFGALSAGANTWVYVLLQAEALAPVGDYTIHVHYTYTVEGVDNGFSQVFQLDQD